ncbi:MAG: serine hydrolase [Bacteroidales bacterium]|nr:serine hydrolase [Candidatus Liminaster caballi]
MRKLFFIPALLVAALFAACSPKQKQQEAEIVDLPRAEVAPTVKAAAEAMLAESDSIPVVTFESVMVLKHGKVVYENWINDAAPDKPHVMWSVSKSFCATAVGMAIDEGLIKLSDPVISFFPDQLPAEVSDNLKAMTVRDLLTMNCGHETEPNIRVVAADIDNNPDWISTFLAHPVTKQPGTWYCYNSIGTFMLSAIVQKVTGQKVNDYLTTRLWEPLHIETPLWQENPQGINLGGWGLHLKTEDMAKFGQLFLQKGKWNGQQLVSEAWVEEASKYQVPSVPAGTRPDEVEAKGLTEENCAWILGYGYQMWRCIDNAYRADGAFGQYIYVLPDHDAVIAITAKSQDLQAEVNLIYKHLFPVVENL